MGSCLERCPVEVINAIVESMDQHDIKAICNLRLACRALAAKTSSSHHFQALFKSKHVELKEQALCPFTQEIQAGGLRCLIQNLTLSGFASGDKPRRTQTWKDKMLSSRHRNSSLLSHALGALVENGPTGKLASLSLEVTVSPDLQHRHQPTNALDSFDWRHVWMAAVETFLTAVPSLAGSRIQIESLTIFNGPEQQRCSLPCDVLAKLDWDAPGLRESLSSVRALSISLSNRVFKTDGFGDEDRRGVDLDEGHRHQDMLIAQDESNFTGLASLLQLLPQLKSIDWHYFKLRGELQHLVPHGLEWGPERLLQHVVKLDTLPALTHCSLRGVCARETDLLAFIKRTGVTKVRLINVHLVSGTFRSIFDHCTSAAAPVTELFFDSLTEPLPRALRVWFPVFFFGRVESPLGYGEEGYNCRSLAQSGEDIKKHIRYQRRTIPYDPSPASLERLSRRSREYGNGH